MTLLNGSLDGAGGSSAKRNTRTVTANTTVLSSDSVIYVNAAAGAVRVTFTPTVDNSTQEVTIIKTDATANAVTVYDGAADVGLLNEPAFGRSFQALNASSFNNQLSIT